MRYCSWYCSWAESHICTKERLPCRNSTLHKTLLRLMDAGRTLSMLLSKPRLLLFNITDNGRVNNLAQHYLEVLWTLNITVTSCRVSGSLQSFFPHRKCPANQKPQPQKLHLTKTPLRKAQGSVRQMLRNLEQREKYLCGISWVWTHASGDSHFTDGIL